jgi:nucleotide-binding universal stress UspA family protein
VPAHGKGFIAPADGAVTLKRILIPVDHRPDAQQAVEEAYFLAAELGCRTVEITLLHVGSKPPLPTLYLPHHPGWTWHTRRVPGDAVEEILKRDQEWSPDLIVMATQGHRDFLDALRGSTTERVLRAAHCPVLAVPAKS